MMDPHTQDEIKNAFLAITLSKRQGFHITLNKTLNWLGVFDGKTDIQIKKIIDNIINRDYIRKKNDDGSFNFEENIDYIYIRSKDSKYKNRNPITIPKILYFSDNGFKTFCLSYKCNKSNIVRRYYIQLEEDYISALESSQEKNKKILDTIEQNVKTLKKESIFYAHESELWKKKAISENKIRKIAENDRDEAEIYNIYAEMKAEQCKKNMIELEQSIMEEPELDYYLELEVLKKKYMKPIEVYLVDPQKFIKTPIPSIKQRQTSIDSNELFNENSSDEEENIEKYVSHKLKKIPNMYNIKDYEDIKPDFDEQMYYTLSYGQKVKKHGYIIDILYVTGSNQFKVLKDFLEKNSASPVKNVYQTSINEMKNFLKYDLIKQ